MNIFIFKKPRIQYSVLLRTKIYILLASVFFTSLAGCKSSKGEDNANAGVPAGMVALDLSSYGMQILVNVPDSTNGPLQVTENGQGGADIKVGKNFKITIIEGSGDMALKKNDITSDAVRKFVKYGIEEADAILWEWQIEGMEPEFHFYEIIKSGEKSFEVHDVDGEVFSEKAATEMLNAAKSIRLKPLKEKS